MAMGSYDGEETCELVGIYILSRLSTILDKNAMVFVETTVYWSWKMLMENK